MEKELTLAQSVEKGLMKSFRERLWTPFMNAITKYFEIYKYQYLKSAFQTPVSIRMNLFGVTPVWNDMLQRYSQYTTVPLNFDIQEYVVGKMLDGLLKEMSIEESLIRTDTAHRSETMELLGE